MVIQILITGIGLFIILRAIQKWKQKAVKFSTMAAWVIFWFIIMALIWQPQQTDKIASFLQVGRGADAVFYISIILIFTLFFKLFIRLEKLDAEITALVRTIALLDKKDKY